MASQELQDIFLSMDRQGLSVPAYVRDFLREHELNTPSLNECPRKGKRGGEGAVICEATFVGTTGIRMSVLGTHSYGV